jgi:hypothetical protein
MTSPYSIPTTLDEWTLTASMADYAGTLVDNVYDSNVVLKLLKENKRVIDGGNSIVVQLLKEEQNDGGFYLGADVLNTAQGNYITHCEYKWQNAYEPIVIHRDEERQNSGQAHKIIDLAAYKTMSSEKAIAKRQHMKDVEDWANSAKSNRVGAGKVRDDDEEYLARIGNGPNKKRLAANKKYGYGGKRGRFKQNDPKALNDMSAYNPKGNFAGGKKTTTKKRKGKRARDAAKSKR